MRPSKRGRMPSVTLRTSGGLFSTLAIWPIEVRTSWKSSISLAKPASGPATRPDRIMNAISAPRSTPELACSARYAPISTTPRDMNTCSGSVSVCGQFDMRPAATRQVAAVATRSSQICFCCGSSAKVLTVRMPCTVSLITAAFLCSAMTIWATRRPIGRRNTTTISAITPATVVAITPSSGSM